MLKTTDTELEKISDNDKYLFIEKGLEKEFLILLKDLLKQIMDIAQIMILKNHQHLYHTLTRIIYMVGQRVNIFLMVVLKVKKY